MVQKLGDDASKWNVNEWFSQINVELDKITKQSGKEYFRTYRWKWTAKSVHEPHEPNPEMGIPANSDEMECESGTQTE